MDVEPGSAQVDPRAVPSAGCGHTVEWRGDESPWQAASLSSCGALCTWNAPSDVEAVHFRVRREQSESGWLSAVSGPYATAFAAPGKPRATLAAQPHSLLSVFLTCSLHAGDVTDAGGTLKPGHGHRLASRIQVCFREAGDAHDLDELCELEPQELDSNDAACTVRILAQPHFRQGQRILLAVRLGDDWRWSPWSCFSKPVHARTSDTMEVAVRSLYRNCSKMKYPILQTAGNSLVVKPISPVGSSKSESKQEPRRECGSNALALPLVHTVYRPERCDHGDWACGGALHPYGAVGT